MELCTEWGTGR